MLDEEKGNPSLELAAAAVDAAARAALPPGDQGEMMGASALDDGVRAQDAADERDGARSLFVCMAVFMADLYRISLALQRESKGDQEGMED